MAGNPALRRTGFEGAAQGNKIARQRDIQAIEKSVVVAAPLEVSQATPSTPEGAAAAAASSAAQADASAVAALASQNAAATSASNAASSASAAAGSATAAAGSASAAAASAASVANLVLTGTGSPEGVVTATVGKLYLRTDGGAGTTLYVKESGTGNTGWVAK